MTRILKPKDRVRVKATGQYGLVDKISTARRKWPVLVEHDKQVFRSYAPAELLYVPDGGAAQECAVEEADHV